MNITQSQKAKKFSISLNESELITMYFELPEGVTRSRIARALIEYRSEEETLEEFGLTPTEFYMNVGIQE